MLFFFAFMVPSVAGRVVKVLKGVYGLRQAPRLWYERLAEEIRALGFRQMKLERTLYVLDDPAHPGRPMAIVGTHVDDLLCAWGLQCSANLNVPSSSKLGIGITSPIVVVRFNKCRTWKSRNERNNYTNLKYFMRSSF